jgi:hypothetical protein
VTPAAPVSDSETAAKRPADQPEDHSPKTLAQKIAFWSMAAAAIAALLLGLRSRGGMRMSGISLLLVGGEILRGPWGAAMVISAFVLLGTNVFIPARFGSAHHALRQSA